MGIGGEQDFNFAHYNPSLFLNIKTKQNMELQFCECKLLFI